jgi:hypothetical protein
MTGVLVLVPLPERGCRSYEVATSYQSAASKSFFTINLNFMETKHEGKCCERCYSEILAKGEDEDTILEGGEDGCINPNCSCHTKPTEAGMREEFKEKFGIHGWMVPANKLDPIADWRLARLSRLHSQIIEGIDFLPFRSEHIYDDKTADKIKEIINQAFKDL